MSFDASTMGKIALGGQVAGGVMSVFSAYRNSRAQQQGYEYQAAVARNNATLAEWQARDALERGKTAEGNVRLRGAALRGKQEAAFGARNVAMNEGSALRILADTAFMTERDALTTRDNSAKEAWALREQAKGYDNNAAFLGWRADSQSPYADAFSTLLTAGGKVASSWYTMKTRTQAPGRTSNYFYDE